MTLSDTAPTIVWFRYDLRLADHPALAEAVASGRPILPLYILESEGRPLGGASRWWLDGSLTALARSLGHHRAPLLLRRGKAIDVLPRLARETGAAAVHWNRPADAISAARDAAVSAALRDAGIEVAIGPPDLLAAPDTTRSREGRPLRVFARGAISLITCCASGRTWRPSRCGRDSPISPGVATPGRCEPGSAAAPAIRWSTPRCASCGAPAGWRTACAWW
jgi:hypothetical protein